MHGPILLRADATVRMGTGHVMRCLALAHAAQTTGFPCIFVSASSLTALPERVSAEGFDNESLAAEAGTAEDAQKLIRLAERVNASWVVIDGYDFSADYQRSVKDAGHKLLAIDDFGHARRYRADIVVNPTPRASRSLYEIDEHSTTLLLGPRYALLRREFWGGAGARTYPEVARSLLVTLGGSDADNVTGIILRAITMVEVELDEAVVVIGRNNPNYESLAAQAGAMRASVSIVLDPGNMAELMRRADIAVSASGGTALELAAMGVPALLVPIADNQLAVARSLHDEHVAIGLGRVSTLRADSIAAAITDLMLNRARRVQLSSNGRALVDGKGAQRVVEAMETKREPYEARITIRAASSGDARLLWEWANDPAVRAVSFSSDPISWHDHLCWIARKLNDPACRLLIGVNENSEPIGQVRFEVDDRSAKLSVSLDARLRGRGYSTILLRKATRELFLTTEVKSIEAFVKPANDASLRAFRKAGFTEAGERSFRGHAAVRFVLERSTWL
jgi:UDP-2,4-diacetamido-2,4,6-trideoxy-beta-L-altropyranose hydrolase